MSFKDRAVLVFVILVLIGIVALAYQRLGDDRVYHNGPTEVHS